MPGTTMTAVAILAAALSAQAPREVLLAFAEPDAVSESVVAHARAVLPPSVRWTRILGDPARYPYPEGFRARGVVVVADEASAEAVAGAAPSLRRLVAGRGLLAAGEGEVRMRLPVPDRELRDWVAAVLDDFRPLLEIAVPAAADPILPGSLRIELDAAGRLPDLRALRPQVSALWIREGGGMPALRDALERSEAAGLPVVTNSPAVWALGAVAAVMPDLSQGGSLLAVAISRLAAGRPAGSFSVPVLRALRPDLLPPSSNLDALRARAAADRLAGPGGL